MVKNVMAGTYMKNGEEVSNFNFYTELSVSDKLTFVNSVVDILVDGINYNSVIRDLLFDMFLIDIFSDVDVSKIMNSNNFLDDAEDFLLETNIVSVIKANVDYGLIDELNNAIDLNVEYKTGISLNPLNDALSRLVNTIERKLDDMDLDAITEMAGVFADVADDFTTENIVKAYINMSEQKDKKSKKSKK